MWEKKRWQKCHQCEKKYLERENGKFKRYKFKH